MNQTDRIPGHTSLLLLLLALLWGGNVVAIKLGLTGAPPYASAAIRFGVALPFITIWARIRGTRLIPYRRELARLLLFASVFVIQIILLNLGVQRSTSGRAIVLFHAYPVFVAVISHFVVPGDKLSKGKIAGLSLAFAGIVVVFGIDAFDPSGRSFIGDTLVFASGVTLAVLVVMISQFGQEIEPLRLIAAEMVFGVPAFVLGSILFERGVRWSLSVISMVSFGYQALVISVFCFIALYTVLRSNSPSRASVAFFTSPLWGVFLGFIVFGENVSPSLITGAVLVAAGIFVSNRY